MGFGDELDVRFWNVEVDYFCCKKVGKGKGCVGDEEVVEDGEF